MRPVTLAQNGAGVAVLVEVREVIAAFQAIVGKKALTKLGAWLGRARSSLVTSFASGVIKIPPAAASVTITRLCSDGRTVGQVTKPKLLK